MRSGQRHFLVFLISAITVASIATGFVSGCGKKEERTSVVVSEGTATVSNASVPSILTDGRESTRVIAETGYTITEGRVVFLRKGDVCILDPGSGGVTQLTNSGNVTAVCTQRDEGTIAYATWNRDDIFTVETMNLDGSNNITVLSGYQMEPIISLSFSPEGNTCYVGNQPHQTPFPSEIGCIDLRTGEARPIEGPVKTGSTGDGLACPAVSPDGTKLAYIRFIWGAAGSETEGAKTKLSIMSVDGSDSHDIADLEVGPPAGWGYVLPPAWSFDGTMISFVRNDGQIWIVGADGAGPRKLTNLGVYCNYPDWSPDGTLIMFNTDTNEIPPKSTLLSVPVSGGLPARVTDGNSDSYGRFIR
ncbi:MAG: hypothetical protein KKB90_12780 [Actinobacteria bacterium]|nr:hypothetical protein [Actinomycetota bacterium]MBU4219814.1 hypothetical protein [Actinomycetota bacterium]MBU4358898.1 hypothetical protein [Actinomycetota bacterium]MCG2817523.1 hypothetical protein [Actinomycetes bacterium]